MSVINEMNLEEIAVLEAATRGLNKASSPPFFNKRIFEEESKKQLRILREGILSNKLGEKE